MKIVKRTSCVDQEKCVGCKTCELHCPTGAIRIRAGQGEEEYQSPCMKACPAGIDVSGYIALAADGRYDEAYRLIRRDNPFPSVCGRICTHECQLACNRCNYDNSVAIRDIKRFVSDKAFEHGVRSENVWPSNGKRVGVIGAGPSGLSAAYYLVLSGYEVDVYDSASAAGGILLYGIPEWRLPRDVIAREVKVIESAGVRIHLNTEIGKDKSFDELRNECDAVYIATGTQFSRKAGVEGEDLPGVTHGLDFLRNVNSGNAPDLTGRKVAVIGGGNTAMDASRTARRLGAEDVTVVYRRREVEMPAEMREVMEAKEEGVKIMTLAAPLAFEGDGKVERIRCSRMAIGDKDENGRRSVTPTGEEFSIDADCVIVAVSQYSDFPFISKDEVEMTKWGKLIVGENLMTTMDGVFAGGDVARGSATAIEAIADGKKAAKAIASYLGLATEINQGADIELPARGDKQINYASTGKMRNADSAERVRTGEEVALGLTEEMLKFEAARCYRCSGRASVDRELCVDCGLCWEHCNYGAIEMKPLEQPIMHAVPPVIEPQYFDQIHDILKKAHYMPMHQACVCSMTFAWEIAYAIAKGARTVRELTIATGIRSGCSIYCIGDTQMIMKAAGCFDTAPADGNWHDISVNLYDLDEAALGNDKHVDLQGSREKVWNDDAFEAAWADFVSKQEARRNG